ncbi:uncharacterized protein LOC129591435 [Paramacrobiotus metropolitanus]|uniref:uncharacterized protein LOC129591435 n=1 Tax=Paramacrobiotus metropolitanus TaxID=2943436 RepID=UPI002445B8F9|nr:uncharacterized protein LOC129591435 [Paramacrobiotus metropolitanus]
MQSLQILAVTLLLGVCSLSWTIGANKIPDIKTIRHSVIRDHPHPEEQDALMQLLLARWKTVLSKQFHSKTEGIFFLKEEAKSTDMKDQRTITYEVDFITDDASPHFTKAQVVAAINKSMKGQPIAGVHL